MTNSEYRYGVKCVYSGSMNEIEDWLDSNCEKGYAYSLEDVKETGSVFNQLEVIFRFEIWEDREKFKEMMRKRG